MRFCMLHSLHTVGQFTIPDGVELRCYSTVTCSSGSEITGIDTIMANDGTVINHCCLNFDTDTVSASLAPDSTSRYFSLDGGECRSCGREYL